MSRDTLEKLTKCNHFNAFMHAVPKRWKFSHTFPRTTCSPSFEAINIPYFVEWFFSVPLTLHLTWQGFHCLGSVCQSHLQGCGLVSRKELKTKITRWAWWKIMHLIHALSQTASAFVHSENKNCFWNFHKQRKHQPTL